MAAVSVQAVPIADHEIGPGAGLQEVAEVFGAHRGLEVVDLVGPGHVGHQLAHEFGFARVVHRGGVVALKLEIAVQLEGLRRWSG